MTDRLPCPHCGEMFTDLWEYFSNKFGWHTADDSQKLILECDCGEAFEVERRVDVEYEVTEILVWEGQ